MNITASDVLCGNSDRIGCNKVAATMEEPQTPGSDCNSNPATDPIVQDLINSDFIQDNSEYQWFIDYNYRDGSLPLRTSVLSSLSASYTQDDLGYYDDLARDANLAEVDMENFRTSDIHTLLSTLPAAYADPTQRSEGEDSACSTTDTISICKSSLLFSPVKEAPVLPSGGSYSVDSLDCEDMLLTCQTNNKNNYTIAFEGSVAMYSDGSQDFEGQDKQKKFDVPEMMNYDKVLEMANMLDLSMACSDSKIYTTWSNLKYSSINKTMFRHPSGNNNTMPNMLQMAANSAQFSPNKRSRSLPDLNKIVNLRQTNLPLNFSVDSAESSNQIMHLQNSGDAMSSSINDSNSTNNTSKKMHNLSLVRLFMKQKSMSIEGMSLTLDQSDSTSDKWPTGGSCTDSSSNTNTNTQIPNRHTINNQLTNDFSINWLKPDDNRRNNFSTDNSLRTSVDSQPKTISPNKATDDVMNSSVSIEELSEEVSKSQLDRKSPRMSDKVTFSLKTTGTQVMTEVEENGVQTSFIYPDVNVNKSTSNPLLKETVLNKKPVYIFYPNYALPDLSFISATKDKFENISLKPQNLGKPTSTWKRVFNKGSRPFSCNDIDSLKQRGFSHIKDWESLTFLLPSEYRKILHNVPEVAKHIKMGEEVKKPLFCLSPPTQYRRTLNDYVPNYTSSSSSTTTQPSSGYRGSSTILSDSSLMNQPILSNNNVTNPLYLYRYDSISSETGLAGQNKPPIRHANYNNYGPGYPKGNYADSELAHEHLLNKAPPRPPLPRSILRKNNKTTNAKRCSMFETTDDGTDGETKHFETNKQTSLQDLYYINNDLKHNSNDDSDKDVDEVEEKFRVDKLLQLTSQVQNENAVLDSSEEDIRQLEEFMKRSGFSSNSDGDDENSEIKLRSCVRKFLNLRMNKNIFKTLEMVDSQKKTVSFAMNQNQKRVSPNKAFNAEPDKEQKPNWNETTENHTQPRSSNINDKRREMIWCVNKAVNILLKYWHTETPVHNQRQNYNETNECAQLCISNLCPALYAIMSDGLKPCLESTFGPITNSVWQVVEASSQQGPLTKTLNDLVQKINTEDFITEGMLKFHAFIFGLLNLRALDAWFAYLCTRESILRKHYNSNSLFVDALACINTRDVVDTFLETLQPLSLCPFQLDLLYQYKQLHNSFGKVTNHTTNFKTIESPKKERVEIRHAMPSPRKIRSRNSYPHGLHERDFDFDNATKKRWSTHLPLSSKMLSALEKRGSDDSEDYTDSLEHSPLNTAMAANVRGANMSKGSRNEAKNDDKDNLSGEIKFRKLQEKWELIGNGREDTKEKINLSPVSPSRIPLSITKSKIPRPLTSPVKQQQQSSNVLTPKNAKSPSFGIPTLRKVPSAQVPKTARNTKEGTVMRRTSRVDQDAVSGTKVHLARPSSLPYKAYGTSNVERNSTLVHRRAASTSLPRPKSAITPRTATNKQTPKYARTLTHRLPSNNGHLSFNEGDKLRIILEVDSKWLLCERGEQKGLVPRSCIHVIQT